ncbi:sodium:solute symporter family transporter [Microbacter margulisiae]|uniref:SSS family solute:Na+ symporter n=1 Tax=Microbacter margulisiae TaxID=1350067 RepID=A0A7W5H236_9PORP|nr:sodium/solute symporter [Microbacter margulisiae]MBB3187007.1 SSS family solute:Na+ symporter [Microbacter margulisiae]
MINVLSSLRSLDFVIIAIYLIVLVGIGYWVSFVKKKKENENIFLAEHSLTWPSIGLNMWGTNVGPSMLLASASAGYTTGIVAGNFAWYAFIFILMLAVIFAPRYLGAKVSTLPEYMGKRFGQSTRHLLAWYTLITILISWLSLGLFAGGIMVEQLLGIPMWSSILIMVVLATVLTAAGGLKAIAYTSVFQMILLIVVSLTLTLIGLERIGGASALFHHTPANYWDMFLPNSNKDFPWLAIILGYPVMGIWFWCTEQSMVQSVLGAKNLKQGQLGASFIGWLKILDVPLFIIPGIICFVLFPHLSNPDTAYLVLITNLFPMGMKGLIIVVLLAALIGNVGSSLNSVSTVYTMDIYLKKHNPNATNAEIIKTGRWVTVVSAIVAVAIALAIDNIKGLNLFNIFQSVLGFLAPPMSVTFLFSVLWKNTSRKAINWVLSAGTFLCLAVGILFYDKLIFKDLHFLYLSFFLFILLSLFVVVYSLLDRYSNREEENMLKYEHIKVSRTVKISWGLLCVTMVILYVIFR